VRKRQRLNVDDDDDDDDDDNDDDDHDDAMDATGDDASGAGAPVRCGVELETAVERFLLRMYEAEADDDANSETGKEDAGGVEKSESLAEAQSDRRRWEIWLLGTLKNDNRVTDGGGAVLLQRGLRASNLEFVEGEMRVLQDTPNADSLGSCAREGWAIEVRRWRWARPFTIT
jgi:hypothetical protein